MNPAPIISAFEEWLIIYGPQAAPSTAKKYSATCAEFMNTYGHPAHAERNTFQTWFEFISKESAVSTVNRKIAALRWMVRFMQDKGIREDDPMRGIQMRDVPRRLPRPMAHKDLVSLIDATDEQEDPETALQDRAIIEILYGSGLRRSEVATLCLGNIVSKDLLRVVGKRNKERITIITDPEFNAIRNLVCFRRLENTPGPNDSSFWAYTRNNPLEPIFFRANGSPVKDLKDPGNYIWQRWEIHRKHIGIRGTPHQSRHSFATRIRGHGGDLSLLKDLLGHESFNTVEGYAGLEGNSLARAKQLHTRQLDF